VCGLAAVGAPAASGRETRPFRVVTRATSAFVQWGATTLPLQRPIAVPAELVRRACAAGVRYCRVGTRWLCQRPSNAAAGCLPNCKSPRMLITKLTERSCRRQKPSTVEGVTMFLTFRNTQVSLGVARRAGTGWVCRDTPCNKRKRNDRPDWLEFNSGFSGNDLACTRTATKPRV
jgi:hypothetical protein